MRKRPGVLKAGPIEKNNLSAYRDLINHMKPFNTNRRLRKRIEKLFYFDSSKKYLYYSFFLCLGLSGFFLFNWEEDTANITLRLKAEQELLSPVYSTPTWLEQDLIAVATHGGGPLLV